MSNNLNLDQVAENQAAKEVTINTATGQLDAAITEALTVDLSGSNVTLTNSQYRRNVLFKASPSAATGRVLTLPAIKKLSLVTNVGSARVVVKVGATEADLDPDSVLLIYTDGTTDGLIVAGGGGGSASYPDFTGNEGKFLAVNATEDGVEWKSLTTRYELSASFAGVMEDAELLLVQVMTQSISLPSGMTGSQAKATSATTADTTLTVKKNGASIGTIEFGTADTTGTFTGFSANSFAAGDLLTVEGPTTADLTLAGLSIALVGSVV